MAALYDEIGGSWIGTPGNVLRQAGFTMRFAATKADRRRLGGIVGGSVVTKLSVTEVGEPQTIEAPANIVSFADFKRAIAAVGDAREAG